MDYDEDEEPPLRRGHRNATEAEKFELSKSWKKALYKHQEAANCFLQCLGLTSFVNLIPFHFSRLRCANPIHPHSHPQANRAILLLIAKHTKRFEEIRDKLAYKQSIKSIMKQNGYSHSNHNSKMNDEIYSDLRKQMQAIISFSHKNQMSEHHNSINNHKQHNINQLRPNQTSLRAN